MTKRQFKTLGKNIEKFIGKRVEIEYYIPQIEKYVNRTGTILGVGDGCNCESVIIEFAGHKAIHYTRVHKIIDSFS